MVAVLAMTATLVLIPAHPAAAGGRRVEAEGSGAAPEEKQEAVVQSASFVGVLVVGLLADASVDARVRQVLGLS